MPTGAQLLVSALERAGVEVIFGIPGGAILPAYDPLFVSKIRHVLVRHEQGAGHAAVGYAQASGRVGVMMATSGPGATNLVTALADANMDSVPVVAITGQVPSSMIGTDAFQEADIRGITMPITKHGFLVSAPEEIPAVVEEAFHLAASGRPGPVLVDIPKDVLQAEALLPAQRRPLLGYRPVLAPSSKAVRAALELLRTSSRPVLYVGGGVGKADAASELLEFAELYGAPVVTTLMALGVFPDSHPLHLGMPGMHGSVPAVTALQHSDLVVSIGARFDDRVTGRVDSFAPGARVVHLDVDPAEIGKIRHADAPIVADARLGLEALTAGLRAGPLPDLSAWRSLTSSWRVRFPLGYDVHTDGTLEPQYVLERLAALVGPEAIYASGVGQHQMWASQFLRFERPRSWLNSGGLGTMGYAVPAAMGAKVACPERSVWAVDGDGCFQMTSQELTTCALEGIPIKVLILNNGNLGMVRQWQTLFYEGRYSSTSLSGRTRYLPDFVMLAEAMGCVGLRVSERTGVDAVLAEAMGVSDRPVVIDAVVGADAQVWPMVAAGASNDDILLARDTAPAWDDDL